MAVAFPLKVSSNSRYLVDQNNRRFRVQSEASWDAHLNTSLTDLTTYANDRVAKGFNAFFTYTMNSVRYFSGASTPWAFQLGNVGVAGATSLPFLQNTSGGAWGGDINFTLHDAAFDTPSDTYFAWIAQFADLIASLNSCVVLFPMYLGFFNGTSFDDGWASTMTNAHNTQAVCQAFGNYLAVGHGSFTGFASRTNIIWCMGGDSLPANGSEEALRALKVLQGLQAGGANQLVAMHWSANNLPNNQTDFASSLTSYHSYTHGNYPTVGPTYPEGRAIYGSQSPARPAWLIETNYWGNYGASRANIRYYAWAGALSCVGGSNIGFSPLWGFATGANGTTGTPSGGASTAWQASFDYTQKPYGVNTYVSHDSAPQRWYRLKTAGVSGATGPTGTGSNIIDGACVWTYVVDVSASMGGMANLLNEPATLDFQTMGQILDRVAWEQMVPSALSVSPTIVTSGQGTFATWSNGNPSSGGMDWIPASATPGFQNASGGTLIAYIPNDHSGAFAVTLPTNSTSSGFWVDPVSGATTRIVGNLSSLTIPGANSGGDNDWVLIIQTSSTGILTNVA